MGRRFIGCFWSHENLLYHDYHVGFADMYIYQNLLNYIFKIAMLLCILCKVYFSNIHKVKKRKGGDFRQGLTREITTGNLRIRTYRDTN